MKALAIGLITGLMLAFGSLAYAATLEGTPHADTLTGTPDPDTILGYQGHDHIAGGRGIDRIDGGPGRDTCYGGRETKAQRAKGLEDIITGCEKVYYQ